MKKIFLFLLLILYFNMYSHNDSTELKTDTNKNKIWSLDAGVNIYALWIWRGQKMHNGPDIQPNINFNVKGLNVGAVGVLTWPGANYYELDSYISYDFGFIIPIVTDYWIMTYDSIKYFDWNPSTTGHLLEVGLIIPIKNLTLSGYTMVYGMDINEDGKNYYSTYLEASYKFPYNITFILGGTTGKGLYKQGDFTQPINWNEGGAAIVNIGLNKRFFVKKIPIDTYLYVNPNASRVYVTAIIRLFEN